MSQMLRRPPAKELYRAPQHGPTFAGVNAVGAVDSAKWYGSSSTTQLPFQTTRLDVLQVNPAHEQPRLDFTSGRQPFIRWGVRQWTRTGMTASPRFFGRWFYVGQIQRAYTERARMTGNPSRLGTTYMVPRFTTGPRTIVLGPG